MSPEQEFAESASSFLVAVERLTEVRNRIVSLKRECSIAAQEVEDSKVKLGTFLGAMRRSRLFRTASGRTLIVHYVERGLPTVQIFNPEGELEINGGVT